VELKSTRSLRSILILKNPRFVLLFLFFILNSSLFIFHPLSYALDEGGATTSIEYRSINREAPTTDTNESEINYHLDVWQNLPNAGRLLLWLDWINGKNDDRIKKLGRGFLALKDFRYNDFILNGLVGDSTLIFTNLPEKFSNVTYPDLYFRGFQADLLSKWGRVEVFGGKVARLEGLLGKTYDITDEVLYGFKGNFRPIPRLLLGTGFIRTQDEVDSADQPITKNNNIFLLDSEVELFKWMRWQTEFRRSDFKGEPGIESQSDYLLRFGPMIMTDNFRLEAN